MWQEKKKLITIQVVLVQNESQQNEKNNYIQLQYQCFKSQRINKVHNHFKQVNISNCHNIST